jgi:hypothetical protein
MIKPGDYIIEVSEQTRPDGYPDCQRTIGRFLVTKELIENIEEEVVIALLGHRVMGLLK